MGSHVGTVWAEGEPSLCWAYRDYQTVVVLNLPQPVQGWQVLGWVWFCPPVTAGDGLHMLCGQRRRRGSFTSTLGQSQTVLPAQGSAGSSWLCGTIPASTPWPPCSTSQDTHLDYVLAAAQLFAQVHRVPPCRDRAAIQAILRDVVLPPFSPQEGLQIPLIEEPAEEAQVPTGEVP